MIIDDIVTSSGKRTIKLIKFGAMEGWIIQSEYIRFATSDDERFRFDFTLKVLRHACVVLESHELPLQTPELIENHLESWLNIKRVFEAILIDNGIDPATHADKPEYWDEAGAKMAIAFIAEASRLIGPALKMHDSKDADQEE